MTTNPLTFIIRSDLDLISAERPCQRYIELAVTAPLAETKKERMPLNLALVLDRSGSMSGGKLDYARQAALHVLDLLNETDRVSLVAFDDNIDNLSVSVLLDKANRASLRASLNAIREGGSTNLSGGWLQGCQNAAAEAQPGTLNRALLLTDGQANQGIVGLEELGVHARELHNRGVSTSTFGIGLDFNESLLEYMANQGGGNFYYIESPNLIPDIFMKEFQEISEVTARDVEIELLIPANIDAQVMGSWKSERDGTRLRIFPGDIAAGRSREIYLRLLVPPQGSDSEIVIQGTCRAKGLEGALYEVKTPLTLRYAPAEQVTAAVPDMTLLESAGLIEVADAAAEAIKLEREGRIDEARLHLARPLNLHESNMSKEQRDYYTSLHDRMEHGLEENDRKSSHYNSYVDKQNRGPHRS